MTVQIKVKKLHPNAILPVFAREGDAGADVYACLESSVDLWKNENIVISTGLAFEIPQGYEIQVRSRSGLAAKEGVFVLNSPGTIDSGYRGELKIILSKVITAGTSSIYTINNGDRIAQIVVNKLPTVTFEQVEEFSTNTQRGTDGLGSTGV